MRFACFVTIMLGIVPATMMAEETGEQSARDLEAVFLSLKEGADHATVTRGIERLKQAGMLAFPVLLKHLESPERAAIEFQAASPEADSDPATGARTLAHPRMGAVAFKFIQGAVEGHWPKAYTPFHAITPANAARWLAERKDQSLRALRIDAAQAALKKAEQLHQAKPSEFTKEALEFLQERLKFAESAKE